MKKIFALFSILFLLLSSCVLFGPKTEETAESLAEKGMSEFDKGHYRVAIQTLYQLRDWYPFSKHVLPAELKIADGYYHLKSYERAIFAYNAFESLHPGNDAIPYVINQIGLSHLDGMDIPERDQASAKRALATFQRLRKLFPDSPHARKAEEYIRICRESLAGHELAVGEFYHRSKNYRAAIDRFKGILADYPDVGAVHKQAIDYIDLAERALRDQVPEE